MEKDILTPEMKESLRDSFKLLRYEVSLLVFTRKGSNDPYNEILTGLVKELTALDKRIRADFHEIGGEASGRHGVERSPTLLVQPDKYGIRFTGAPLGEEGRALVMSIIMASTGLSGLSGDSKKRLSRLKDKRRVMVFTSPTCPYCPRQVLYAVSAAVESPGLVSAETVDIYENRDLALKYGALSVPTTFVDGKLTSTGLMPEENFMESVVQARPIDMLSPVDREGMRDLDLIVFGAGPAGLTAAIYAERSGLKTVVLEKATLGGQVAITPVVENYTGFPKIAGKTLVELMAQQASGYSQVLEGVGVGGIKKTGEGFEVSTSRGKYFARGIVIATGARHRTLGVPGEKRLSGRGVSYCSTCDGYFYKDGKNVVVVGGGNTALTDALYLDSLGAHVTVVHYRDAFKGEERLRQGVFQRDINVLFNSRIREVAGRDSVEKVVVEDMKAGESRAMKADALFVAIGYKPNNDLARMLGLELDPDGYIKADGSQRTALRGVYAAGDVTGGVKQIAVAVGQGSVAAISAFEDLSEKKWEQ